MKNLNLSVFLTAELVNLALILTESHISRAQSALWLVFLGAALIFWLAACPPVTSCGAWHFSSRARHAAPLYICFRRRVNGRTRGVMSSKHGHYQPRQPFSAALSRLSTGSANFQDEKSLRIQLKVMSEVERSKKTFAAVGDYCCCCCRRIFSQFVSQLATRSRI